MKIAILSDLHANKYAVEAVFEDIEKECVKHILVAGDLIGYYYWPSEVVQLCMNDSRIHCVQGNHEVNLKKVRKDSSLLSGLTRKYGSGYKICLESMSKDELSWVLSLPETISVEYDGISFFVTHGSLTRIDEYIYPDSSIEKLVSNYSDADFTVFGHTHHPFIHGWNNRYLVNPGSVGQPRDYGNLSSYLIVDCNNRVARIKKVPFEIKEVLAASIEIDPELPHLRNVLQRGTL